MECKQCDTYRAKIAELTSEVEKWKKVAAMRHDAIEHLERGVQYFTIPGRLPGYNELKDGHWAVRAKKKRTAMEYIQWQAKAARIKPVQGKVTISITCYEPNLKRDEDNTLIGAWKLTLDALQGIKILQGDGRKYVALDLRPVEVDRENPRVEVMIKEDKK